MEGTTRQAAIKSATARSAPASSHTKLACYIAGIVGSLLGYGVLQERIMSEPFGDDNEHFRFSLFLVLANRLLTLTVALIFLLVQKSDVRPKAPLYSYAAVSASNVLATTCQYEALKHVTLPVQTLGKCAKMIPVMIWGALILRKTYSARDYGRALLTTAGCTLFVMSGEVSARQAKTSRYQLMGFLLMVGYLACDGFTSTFQSRLFKGDKMTVYNQILYTTLFSAAYSLTGQLFIVHTIRSFGPMLFAVVMTGRQFGTILLSCIIFHHPLSKRQWIGTAAVFVAILSKSSPKRMSAPQLSKVSFSEANLVHGGVAARHLKRSSE